MASEDTELRSEQYSEQGSDRSEDGEWVSKQQAALVLGVTERTIESRLSSGSLLGRKNNGRREVFLRLPKRPIESPDVRMSFSESSEPPMSSIGKPSGVNSEEVKILSEAFSEMMKLSERVLEQSREISEARQQIGVLTGELERKKAELQIMNNERANYNTSLQRYKDNDREIVYYKGETEILRKESESQRMELEALRKENESLKKRGFFSRLLGK